MLRWLQACWKLVPASALVRSSRVQLAGRVSALSDAGTPQSDEE